jgi:hypothetical protein
MARQSAAKSHMHPRSVGLARCGDAATLHICCVSCGTLVAEKDSPRLHCHASVSYSLLSPRGTAVVALQCPTDCMQLPLRLG